MKSPTSNNTNIENQELPAACDNEGISITIIFSILHIY